MLRYGGTWVLEGVTCLKKSIGTVYLTVCGFVDSTTQTQTMTLVGDSAVDAVGFLTRLQHS